MILHLFNAGCTDALAVEINDIVNLVAENAGGLILLQNDLVFVNENFNRVLLLNVQGLSDFDGKNDSAQLVYLANDSRRFHKFSPSSFDRSESIEHVQKNNDFVESCSYYTRFDNKSQEHFLEKFGIFMKKSIKRKMKKSV